MALYHHFAAAFTQSSGYIFTHLIAGHKYIKQIDVVLQRGIDRLFDLLIRFSVQIFAAQSYDAALFRFFLFLYTPYFCSFAIKICFHRRRAHYTSLPDDALVNVFKIFRGIPQLPRAFRIPRSDWNLSFNPVELIEQDFQIILHDVIGSVFLSVCSVFI